MITRRSHRFHGLFLLAAAAAAILLPTGCARYYHGDVAGYIKDSATDNGIDGAIVRIYLTEPAAADDEGFIVETASMTSGGNPGYYSHKIIWETSTPTFGKEGDSGTLWIGVSHEDYIDRVVQVSGVLSDTLNVLPDILLDPVAFVASSVRGTVTLNGQAANGVRVVLRIPSETEGEDPDEYSTTTRTIDEQEGSFEFQDVSWRDETPDTEEGDTQAAELFVDDNNYISSYDTDAPLEITLTSDQELVVDQTLEIMQVTYTCPVVSGRVVNSTGAGVNGVQVVLDLPSTEDEQDYVVTTATYDNQPGTYRFTNVSWRDENPSSPDSDLEEIHLYVDDTDYTGDKTVDAPLVVNMSSDQETAVEEAITVSHNPRTSFSANVEGRLIYRIQGANGADDFPIQGVTVTVTYTDDNGAHQLITTSDGSGVYRFLIQWTNANPITDPEGEDTITIQIAYSKEDAGTARPYDFDNPPNSQDIHSWLDPNYLPDGIDSDPYS